jgi:hypothetical protein
VLRLVVAAVLVATVATACEPAIPPSTVPPVSGDATAAIQQILDDTGAVTIDRELRVDGTIRPPAWSTITFTSDGLLRRTAAAPSKRVLPVIEVAADNVTLVSPRIDGPNPCYWDYFGTGDRYSQYDPKREDNNGISVVSGDGTRVTSPRITNTWGDAIYIGGSHPTDVTITDLYARCLGRSAVSNTGSTGVTIDGADVGGSFWWSFNVEPFNTRFVHDYTVSDATIGFSRDASIFAGGPYFSCDVERVRFDRYRFTSQRTTINLAPCVADQFTLTPG